MSGSETGAENENTKLYGSLQRWLLREAVVISLFSAFIYLTAYWFERAYLSHFGFSEVFVAISVDTLAKTVAAITFFVVAAVNLMLLVPKNLPGFAFGLFFRFLPTIMFAAIAWLFFSSFGWSWSAVALMLISFVAILLSARNFYSELRKGKTFSQVFSEDLEADLNFREKLFLQSQFDKMPLIAVVYFLALFFLPIAVGSLAGDWHAKRERSYATFQNNGGSFIVVGRIGSDLLAVKAVDETDVFLDEIVEATTTNIVIPQSQLSSYTFVYSERMSVVRKSGKLVDDFDRIDFGEFIERLRRVWPGNAGQAEQE